MQTSQIVYVHDHGDTNEYMKVPSDLESDYTSEGEVDRRILSERHDSITQLNQDLEDIAEIQKHMAHFVYTQGKQLDQTHETLQVVEHETQQATSNLEQSETIYNKIRGLFKKGIFVSTGVTGISAAGMLLNPIAGGIGVIIGIGGIVACTAGMKRE